MFLILINLGFSLLPVLLFLVFLYLLDRFRLVEVRSLVICLVWGIISVAAAYLFNNLLGKWIGIPFDSQSRYMAPVVEESLKAIIIIYLLKKKRAGFLVDAAIYGFATGAGFALMENILYLVSATEEASPATWIVRGLGTAVMHGGCTGLMALVAVAAITRGHETPPAIASGLTLAIILHSGFNHFALPPLFQTLLVMILFPSLFIGIFALSNRQLTRWLEIEFSSEVEILSMIRKGTLGETRPGRYLLSVSNRFLPETVVDLYCYLSLYLELSIKAKRNLMLQEQGMKPPQEPDLEEKLTELNHLRKMIGPVGEATMAPLIRMSYRDLWKLNQISPK
ncbi:MAG: PrsW family intramembrane metalloprotease [Bacteroidales bacterium]